MSKEVQKQIAQLEQAIAAQESLRATIGDTVVDATIAALQKQIAELESRRHPDTIPSTQPPDRMAMELQGERKLVTVMFADISGFTAMSETMDPEQVRDLINACFEQLAPVVTKHGGTINKFIGDSILAFFGLPVAYENDPERAVRSALEMMDTLKVFNAARSTDVGIHIGINTGLAIAGGIGTSERQEYSAMGDAVNLASRLEDISGRGQILVGPDTYRLTNRIFDFQEIGPIQVKGRAEPVTIYKVLRVRARPEPLRGLAAQGISSPLVGRDVEFAAFTGCIERLLSGRGSIVSVIGEAGLGKSRLVAEVRTGVAGLKPALPADRELLWLEGRTLSYSQMISYWPLMEIIKNYAGITEEDGEAEAWAKLERWVTILFPKQVSEILPYLASLLAWEVRGELAERVKYLDGEAMGRQIFRALRLFFERLAKERPLVLVFEDLHWVDQSSAELLEHLLPLVETVPLLICCVSRPDSQSPAARLREIAVHDYADRYTEISLNPLSPTDSAQLVRSLLKPVPRYEGIDDLSPRACELILRKAEGNPFFVEEVIRSLIDIGAVVRNEATGHWQATVQLEQITIPDTIQGVIMARVDRLSDDVKQVLKIASVIGRSFFYRVLRTITEVERGLEQCLGELQQLELIRERKRIPELEYIFKHALVQEATYESILLQRRRELHRQVGDSIEALFADRLEEFYALLAYHYARAEEWEKAHDYLLKTGDQASKVAADAEALAHYQQALAAYTRAFGDQWNLFQRAVLERKMGEALFRRGNHQQSIECLQRALTYLGSPFPTSRWGVRLAITRQLVQQVGHRLLPSLFLKHTSPLSADPAMEERFHIYDVMMWIDYFMARERFLLDAITMLNFSERNSLSLGIVRGSGAVGLVCDLIPVFWLAEHYHRRAVALAEQIQNPVAIAWSYLCLGGIHEDYLGKWETGIELCRRAAAAYWEVGDLRRWGTVTMITARLHRLRGNFTDSLELYQNLTQIGKEGGDCQIWGFGLYGLGATLLCTGALGEAVAHLQKSIELFKTIPDYYNIALANSYLGECYLRQGMLEQALAVLEENNQLIAERGLRGHLVTLFCNVLAETYLVAAEEVEEPERTGALKKAKRACQAAMKGGKIYCCGLPHAYRLQGTYEWLKGKPAVAQKWWRRSLLAAEKLGARYELGVTCLEMGKRMGDVSHLSRAEAIFTEIGVVNFFLG